MTTIFRKVSVKERLPKDNIFCDTDKGLFFYETKSQMFFDANDVEYPIDWINYWFEKIVINYDGLIQFLLEGYKK